MTSTVRSCNGDNNSNNSILPSNTKLPRYYNPSTWKLISQGAEARVWFIPSFISTNSGSSTNGDNNTSNSSMAAICKERFAKTYRHPALNDTLTRARTKAESRCLVRCRRGGVNVPIVLNVDINKGSVADGSSDNGDDNTNTNYGGTSACLFLEYIEGCTVREFLTTKPSDGHEDKEEEPAHKRKRVEQENDASDKKSDVITSSSSSYQSENKSAKGIETRLDDYAMKVAYAVGAAIAKMHNVNIIHGDLTTSNIMVRNPPTTTSSTSIKKDDVDQRNGKSETSPSPSLSTWEPDIVLIDFGLATTSNNSHNKSKKNKSASHHEDQAVDLYVLERAFETTHVGSTKLVEELFRAYKGKCFNSDAVLQRLSAVRLRGRKRECFG